MIILLPHTPNTEVIQKLIQINRNINVYVIERVEGERWERESELVNGSQSLLKYELK